MPDRIKQKYPEGVEEVGEDGMTDSERTTKGDNKRFMALKFMLNKPIKSDKGELSDEEERKMMENLSVIR